MTNEIRDGLVADIGAAMEAVIGSAKTDSETPLDNYLRSVALLYVDDEVIDSSSAVISLREALYRAAALGALFMYAHKEGLNDDELAAAFKAFVLATVPDAEAKIVAAGNSLRDTLMADLSARTIEVTYAYDLAEYGKAVADRLRDQTDRFVAEDHSGCEDGACTVADRYAAARDEIIASSAAATPRGQG